MVRLCVTLLVLAGVAGFGLRASLVMLPAELYQGLGFGSLLATLVVLGLVHTTQRRTTRSVAQHLERVQAAVADRHRDWLLLADFTPEERVRLHLLRQTVQHQYQHQPPGAGSVRVLPRPQRLGARGAQPPPLLVCCPYPRCGLTLPLRTAIARRWVRKGRQWYCCSTHAGR